MFSVGNVLKNLHILLTFNRNLLRHVFFKRESKKDGRTERISIETDKQLELEIPSILTGQDKLQRKYVAC